MAQKRISSLGVVFGSAMLAAAGGVFLYAAAAKLAAPYAAFLLPQALTPLAYTLIFLAVFFAAGPAVRAVLRRRSGKKTAGTDAAGGVSPRLARVILAGFVFAVPLYIVVLPENAPQLSGAKVLSPKPAPAPQNQTGYRDRDRDALDALVTDKVTP